MILLSRSIKLGVVGMPKTITAHVAADQFHLYDALPCLSREIEIRYPQKSVTSNAMEECAAIVLIGVLYVSHGSPPIYDIKAAEHLEILQRAKLFFT
jgi:hypothetical protein